MADLTSTSPAAGLLPLRAGDLVLHEIELGPVTSVAPFKGRMVEVSWALKEATGALFPGPNRVIAGKSGARALWIGPGQALVLGAAVALEGAACTDQSDAFAALELSGPRAADALARLVPIDLRPGRFAPGQGARTLLGHMTCSLICAGPESYQILVFRSMAGTAVHEIHRAMRTLAAL